MSLKKLEAALRTELTQIEIPPASWLTSAPKGVWDVAIIGGGMAGLSVGFALKKEGIVFFTRKQIVTFDSVSCLLSSFY